MADLKQLLKRSQDKLRGMDWFGVAVGFLMFVSVAMLIGLIVSFPFVIKAERERDARFMSQCLDDGRKEYECVAILRRSDTTVVPIITPMPMIIR